MKIISILFFFIFPLLAHAKIDTVIIDPGHGGKDPGAIEKSLGLKEKEVNLRIALYLRNQIRRRLPWLKVVLTRDRDRYVSLEQRCKVANSFSTNSAVFISIHTNSHDKRKKVEGVEVFFYSRPSAKIRDERRDRIEKFYTQGFSDSYKGLLSRMINAKLKADSKLLARHLAKGLKLASREPIRRVSFSNFFVVAHPVIPSALVEVGFISSKKFLRSYYQKKIAKGILVGILSFLKKEDKF